MATAGGNRRIQVDILIACVNEIFDDLNNSRSLSGCVVKIADVRATIAASCIPIRSVIGTTSSSFNIVVLKAFRSSAWVEIGQKHSATCLLL